MEFLHGTRLLHSEVACSPQTDQSTWKMISKSPLFWHTWVI